MGVKSGAAYYRLTGNASFAASSRSRMGVIDKYQGGAEMYGKGCT